jgi:ABC-type Mn2+/Zn2+ transport system ATPase subunit
VARRARYRLIHPAAYCGCAAWPAVPGWGMLAARNLTVVRGAQVVLDSVDLVVDWDQPHRGAGAQRAGKTTLLRCLAGLEVPTGRDGRASPPGLNVGYLAQEPDPRPGETTAAYLRRRTGLALAEEAMEAALRPSATTRPAELEAYDDALARFLASAATTTTPAPPACSPTSASTRVCSEVPLAGCPGGQRVKAGLAAILLARFDVLLLDEPTNNLDFDGLARLERFLAAEERPVVLVSHDRAFLSATTTRIAELDLHSRRSAEYGGGYDAYVEERRRRREQAYADYDEARAEAGPPRGGGPPEARCGRQPPGRAAHRQRQGPGRAAQGAGHRRGDQGQGDRAAPGAPRRPREALGGLGPAPVAPGRPAQRRGRGQPGRGRRRARPLPARPGRPGAALARPPRP